MKLETTQQHKDDAMTLMRGVRLGMIRADKNKPMNLYGITSTNLKLKATPDIPTLATDGSYLYFNPHFVLGIEDSKLEELLVTARTHPIWTQEIEKRTKLMYSKKSEKFLRFGIVHEMGHIICDHFTMVGTRDKQLFNKAADFRINADSSELVYGSYDNALREEPVFELFCFDKKYVPKEWTSVKIYEDLLQNENNNNQETLDTHVHSDGKSQEESELDKFIRDLLGIPNQPTFSKESTEDVELNNNRLRDSFMNNLKDIGDGCGGWLLEQLKANKPVINWKRLYRKSLSGLNKRTKDPSKLCRSVHGLTNAMHQNGLLDKQLGLYRAGKKPEPTINVYEFFDLSGSISDSERTIFLSETLGITRQYREFNLTVGCWDTVLYLDSIRVFTKQNQKEIKDYKFTGGGGTDVNCLLPYLNELNLRSSDRIVIFTDCYFNIDVKSWKKYENCIIIISTVKNQQSVFDGLNFKYIEYDQYM